jgi:hypothetical protein
VNRNYVLPKAEDFVSIIQGASLFLLALVLSACGGGSVEPPAGSSSSANSIIPTSSLRSAVSISSFSSVITNKSSLPISSVSTSSAPISSVSKVSSLSSLSTSSLSSRLSSSQSAVPISVTASNYVLDDQSAVGTVIGEVVAVDPQNRALTYLVKSTNTTALPFTIDSTGTLRLSKKVNRSSQSTINFDVEVSAGVSRATARSTMRVTTTALVAGQKNAVGVKKALWLRPSFNGIHTDETDAAINDAMMSANNYLKQESYGQVSMTWLIAPVIETGEEGTTDNPYTTRDAAARSAKANNSAYDADNFDMLYMTTNFFGGGGALGIEINGKGTMWIGSPLWAPGTIHESFHGLGVGHAEILMGSQSYPAPVGSGGHDPYFFMGSEGADTRQQTQGGQYSISAPIPLPMKYRLGWLREANILDVNASGTYRIYSSHFVSKPGLKLLGLRLLQASDQLYISYEPNTPGKDIVTRGLIVHAVPNDANGITRLLDANPNSVADNPNIRQALNEVAEMSDAAIVQGRSMSIGNAWAIDFVAQGGSGENLWADIRVRKL